MNTTDKNLIARTSILINASSANVWDALVNPAAIKEYMFGTNVVTDWREGSPILWQGEWQGKAYEDKGVIQQFKPLRTLQYTHFSPLAGLADTPENYHTVTINLAGEGQQTRVSLSQDKNANEKERDESQKTWNTMLMSLKKYVEE